MPHSTDANRPAYGPYHAVVLAAQRPGIINALANSYSVTHKCMINMAGRPLIDHVLQGLIDSPEIGYITISIDDLGALDAAPLVEQLAQEGRLRIVLSGETLYESVRFALNSNDRFPAIITTADNVLLTPEMVGHFCAGLGTLDGAVALTSKETLALRYPTEQKKFHKFRDGEWSNCNLYAIQTPKALGAAETFKGGGQFAKSPRRALAAFGLVNTLIYRFSLLGREQALARLGRRFGINLGAVTMPFPESPVDVDNEASARIAREVLEARLADPAGPSPAA